MVYEETVRNLKETQLEAEKAQKKLEVGDNSSILVVIFVPICSECEF